MRNGLGVGAGGRIDPSNERWSTLPSSLSSSTFCHRRLRHRRPRLAFAFSFLSFFASTRLPSPTLLVSYKDQKHCITPSPLFLDNHQSSSIVIIILNPASIFRLLLLSLLVSFRGLSTYLTVSGHGWFRYEFVLLFFCVFGLASSFPPSSSPPPRSTSLLSPTSPSRIVDVHVVPSSYLHLLATTPLYSSPPSPFLPRIH